MRGGGGTLGLSFSLFTGHSQLCGLLQRGGGGRGGPEGGDVLPGAVLGEGGGGGVGVVSDAVLQVAPGTND